MNLNVTTLRRRWSAYLAVTLPLLLLAGVTLAWQVLAASVTLAQMTSGITSPASGETVTDTVPILGTATDDAFQRYELHYKPSEALASAYIYFADGTQSVADGQLGVWDTTSLEPGSYNLRLRVVRTDGNYTEYFVEDLQVGTAAQTPSEQPTAVITATDEVTATVEPTVEPTVEVTITEEAEPVATVTTTATTTTAPQDDGAADLPPGAPQLTTTRNINVRSGPGTNYPVVAALQAGDSAPILGQNQASDWWQIQVGDVLGWVLGSLVDAQNTGTVPVVDAPPAPAATPTSTAVTGAAAITPTAAVTTTQAITTVDTGQDSAQGDAAIQIAVSLTGNASDPAALALFVRALLANFGPDNATVTATVGGLPGSFPVPVTVPTTATIVGGVTRAGEFGGDQIYLSTQGNADGLVAALQAQLVAAGFTAPPVPTAGGSEIFLSSSPFGTPITLCGPDDELLVTVTAISLSGEAVIVSLNANSTTGFGGPCSEGEDGATSSVFGVFPSMTSPVEAQVRGGGASSSSGADGFTITAEADIESNLAVSALAEHYETQLEDAGWERVSDSATEDLSWSAWTLTGDDAVWNATFYVVRKTGDEGSYRATLYGEAEQ